MRFNIDECISKSICTICIRWFFGKKGLIRPKMTLGGDIIPGFSRKRGPWSPLASTPPGSPFRAPPLDADPMMEPTWRHSEKNWLLSAVAIEKFLIKYFKFFKLNIQLALGTPWAAAVFRDLLQNGNGDPPLRAHPRVARFKENRSMGVRWWNRPAIAAKKMDYCRRWRSKNFWLSTLNFLN